MNNFTWQSSRKPNKLLNCSKRYGCPESHFPSLILLLESFLFCCIFKSIHEYVNVYINECMRLLQIPNWSSDASEPTLVFAKKKARISLWSDLLHPTIVGINVKFNSISLQSSSNHRVMLFEGVGWIIFKRNRLKMKWIGHKLTRWGFS